MSQLVERLLNINKALGKLDWHGDAYLCGGPRQSGIQCVVGYIVSSRPYGLRDAISKKKNNILKKSGAQV